MRWSIGYENTKLSSYYRKRKKSPLILAKNFFEIKHNYNRGKKGLYTPLTYGKKLINTLFPFLDLKIFPKVYF